MTARTPAIDWERDDCGSERAEVCIGPLVVRLRASFFRGQWLTSLRRKMLDGERRTPATLAVSDAGPEVLIRYGELWPSVAAARTEAELLLDLVFGPASAWPAEGSTPNHGTDAGGAAG